MRKILPLLLLAGVLLLTNNSVAQCVVKNVIVKVNASTPINADSCLVNFDFIFTIENNGGNKYIYLHAWLENEYPNFFGCPTPSNNHKVPVAADLALSRINIGIHNEVHAGHPAPTLITSYLPDLTVVMSTASGLERFAYPSGDSARFVIKGVEIAVPLGCSSIISLKADYWSSQAAAAQNAQCVSCGSGVIIDPRAGGFINCNTPRTFNVLITSVAPAPISGVYYAYIDHPSDPLVSGSIGTFGPEDVLAYSSPFTTVINGSLNRYAAFNVAYPPYNTQIPDADRNIWILVETIGYSNKAINLLVNACAPLDLKMTSFTVEKRNGISLLQWKTEEEINMSGFYVERKTGSGQFEPIGFVNAKSLLNSDASSFSYSYTDNGLANGSVTFYRLKMVDNDGRATYSDIKAIRNNDQKMYVTIHPNPSNGMFKVAVPSDAGVYDVMVADYCGKVLKTMNALHTQTLQMNNLLPGVYILKISFRETGESITERIIVQ